ncbi:MAG TPA: DEAD/DEAH box helicase [Allosphingosinicella sp.]|jgi:superfamily II DNA/RNA helicase
MSLSELQNWLVDERLLKDLAAIARRTIRSELDNLLPEPQDVHAIEFDWARLLLAGSILAPSDHRPHQEAALRIATAAVTLSEREDVKDAGSVLLGKLSNFRAVALAYRRDLIAAGLDNRLGTSLRIEAQRRLLDQAVLLESSGQWLQVNEFQLKFWNQANDHQWLSASAPTASGKTFLVLQWLVDQVRSRNVRIAAYLAPTRALVSEIESNLLALLGKNSGINVSSLPLSAKYNVAAEGGAPLILVLTQERLHLLANILADAVSVDLLIVDEAHKIGDHQRGVILQEAIERVSRSNPDLKLVFISPATQNPEELLADAPLKATVKAVDSDAPTVLQNLIVAEQVSGKPKLWQLSTRQLGAMLPIGVLELGSSPSTVKKKLAFIAAAAGERGGTLIYANGAAEAEEVADLISQMIPPIGAPNQSLLELSDLVRKTVHPDFRLAPLVECGVAFHYGNMPSLIRIEIEKLFRSGQIRFLVCTSTLIEGVNLSCRTIVVRGPRKGMGNPMEPHDFWNLAGRAGRWGDEFQGNIICVDPHDTNAWPDGVPSRARYPIKRESDAVIGLGDGLADYLDRRTDGAFDGADKYEQVGSYLLSAYLRSGSIKNGNLAKRHPASTLARLDQSLAAIADKIEITSEVAGRHPGVSALALQSMLNAFRKYKGDPENLIPTPVDSQDSYDRFITIMRRINSHLYPAFLPEGLIPLHALIVVQWLKGYSLALMIRRNIEYHRRVGKAFRLPILIRHTMEIVEQTARFRAPKYFSAYVDILDIYLREAGREDLIEHDLDIGTQLEFGVSARTMVSLIELGLSRTSAVALYEKIARDDLTKEECVAWVTARQAQFEAMGVAVIIAREVRDKLLPPLEP